jgi:phage terminase large subunit-like protein
MAQRGEIEESWQPKATPAPPTLKPVVLGPQSWPQLQFAASSADIVVGGGAAGGGKTWSLLWEPLRHIPTVPFFRCVGFRRTAPRITNEGGLWDESVKLYGELAEPQQVPGNLEWRWPNGSTVRFTHLQYIKNAADWKGAQVPLFLFDQLEEFEAAQFWYISSRSRSLTGKRQYIRATANPDPDSFLATLVDWWIDPDSGYPIPHRSGVVRYFVRNGDTLHWANDPDSLIKFIPKKDIAQANIDPRELVKSFTFIPSTVYDNKVLMRENPAYLAELLSLPYVEMERLLRGNWKIRPEAGKVFNKKDFKIMGVDQWDVHLRLGHVVAMVRYWDKAGTEEALADEDMSWTVGILMAKVAIGIGDAHLYIVVDEERGQWAVYDREPKMHAVAERDRQMYEVAWNIEVQQYWEQEPGSGGKDAAWITAAGAMAGYTGGPEAARTNKMARLGPWSSAVKNGTAWLVAGQWNEEFMLEHHRVPGKTMDRVDASASAYRKLVHAENEKGDWLVES